MVDNPLGGFSKDNRGRSLEDADELRGALGKMLDQANATLRAFEDARAETGALVAEGRSEDGRVLVVLDDDGSVSRVDIDEAAMGHPASIGPSVLDAIHRAQAEHARQMAAMADKLAGMDVMKMVNDAMPEEMRDRFRREQPRW